MTTPVRPLGDRVIKPLRTATLWGLLTLAVGAALALIVGVGGAGISWIMERFDQTTFGWPTELLIGIASIIIPLSIASATWAASYISTDRMPAGRAVLATGVGVAVLAGFAFIDRPVGLLAGAGAALALAMPFETWSRLAARVVPLIIVVGALAWIVVERQALLMAGFLALAYPVAAILVWLGDAGWVRRARRQ
jgi:hypothetical protein